MQTIIFADRKESDLGPLGKNYCPALLPIGGRATILHTIEDLAFAGIKKVSIVISSQAYNIESLLGDGARWGMQIEYLLSKGEEKPSTVLSRCGEQLKYPYLILRGDILRSPVLESFLDATKNLNCNAIHGHIHTQHAGIILVRNSDDFQSMDKLHWPNLINELVKSRSLIQLEDADISYLDSMNEYFTSSLAIARGHFKEISHIGLTAENGLIHGRNCNRHKKSEQHGKVCLGNNVRIESEVKIQGPVIIGDGAMVDKGASLHNCIILPDTYIGCDLSVRNAIVSGGHIYRMDSGINLRIDDNFLLSSISQPLAPYFDRLIGILLLAASSPLWLASVVLAFVYSPGEPLQHKLLNSNRLIVNDDNELVNDVVNTYEWNVSIPILRQLPKLLSVIKGDLRLIGANPEVFDEENTDIFTHDSQHKPQLGLLSTALIELPTKTPKLDIQINEVVYDKKRTFFSDFRYALSSVRFLFSPRAWNQAQLDKLN